MVTLLNCEKFISPSLYQEKGGGSWSLLNVSSLSANQRGAINGGLVDTGMLFMPPYQVLFDSQWGLCFQDTFPLCEACRHSALLGEWHEAREGAFARGQLCDSVCHSRCHTVPNFFPPVKGTL